MFKKGERVVRVIHVGTFKSASLVTVSANRGGVIEIEDSGLKYSASTGAEIGPVLARCHSELISLDEDDHAQPETPAAESTDAR